MSLWYATPTAPLIIPTAELQACIESKISTADVSEFLRRYWPGKNLTGLTFWDQGPTRPIKLQRLCWPLGASRFAIAHYLINDSIEVAIRAAQNQNPLAGLRLHIEQNNELGQHVSEVNANMYALPIRPLFKFVDNRRLYLLTLVDQRFYWWRQDMEEIAFGATTTWDNLYSYLGLKLGISINADHVDPAYGRPDNHSPLNANYENIPLLLDAIAYNCGQRIVCLLDGTVRAMNYGSSFTSEASNQTLSSTGSNQGGGQFTWSLAQ